MEEAGVRLMVTSAALRAAQAATAPGLAPETRLKTLMECHGLLLGARGPVAPLSFGAFRRALRQDLAALLPAGIDPLDMRGLTVIDTEGRVSEDVFDLDLEQRMLLHALSKLGKRAGTVTEAELQSEIDQEIAFTLLRRQGDQAIYENGRSDLIRHPAGAVADLCELRLPPLIVDMYQDIPYASIYEGWWYPCPVCAWPMRLSLRPNAAGALIGRAVCWHAPHAHMGAAYLFQPGSGPGAPHLVPERGFEGLAPRDAVLHPDLSTVPQALPAAHHKAVARGIWRYTTVPGIPELALYDALVERGLVVHLWPVLDTYDLLVEVGSRGRKKELLKVDVKDYTSAATLGELVHAQAGDAGGAEWLVVPDYRSGQVPLLSGVCGKYGVKVATATDFAVMACERSGVGWA